MEKRGKVVESEILTALRTAIQERGLTIAAVAMAAGIHRANLSQILRGKIHPTLPTLCRVCGVLRIEIIIINQPAVKVGKN